MYTAMLILHGLCAVALLGAVTHQALAACWPARTRTNFVASFRAVPAASYTNAIIVLFLITFVLGGLIYPAYRVAVRTYLENARLWAANGSFEVKEQFVTIGLGMLPFYWLVWRQPLDRGLTLARRATTAALCFIVWFGFLVGHVLNNIRGLFGQ